MALIKCPECGGEISASAEKCVHCGCKFTVCPDCGNATVGDMPICPSCGCKITTVVKPKDKPASKLENQEKAIAENFYNEYVNCLSFGSVLFKKKKLISRIFDIAGGLLFIIAAAIFVIWYVDDPISRLNDYISILTAVRCVCILGVVLCGISGLNDFNDIIGFIVTLRIAKNRKADMAKEKAFIKSIKTTAFVTDESNIVALSEYVSFAVYLRECSKALPRYIFKYIILFAVATVACVGVAMFLYVNAEILMNTMLLDISFDGEYTWLIVAGAALVVLIVLSIFDISGFDKRHDKWQSAL